nr:PAS domain-containing protein [Prosthecomicrobium pneumaticum]
MIFGTAPNPYVVLDRQFVIVAMNAAYLAVTGRRREDIVGRGIFEAFPSDPASDSHRQLRTSLENVLRHKAPDHLPLIHYDIALPDGSGFEERYWSATHAPLFGRDGEVALILQHTQDVTELHGLRLLAGSDAAGVGMSLLRRAQEVQETNAALEAERRQLQALFAQAPGFVAVLSGPSHVFTMTNQAYRRLVGNRPILGRDIREALPEVAEQGFVGLLDQVYETGRPFVGRTVQVLLDYGDRREEHFLDFVYQPIAAADGTVSGIFVQGHDVTEQKRAADALRESEARFRLVAENAPVMLWMGDQHGKCVYLNRMQREFWGVAEEEITRFDWFATIHPDDFAQLAAPFETGMRNQAAFEVEARFRCAADGAYRILRTSAQPRFDGKGAFLGMIGVNMDVTETRRAEEELRRLAETLESRVISEIAERRQAEATLVQMQKMEAIGKLTGGVAHDFNNLLQVVSGNLHLLAKDVAGNERAERRVANALAGVSRGAKLAGHLLAFGRRQALEPKVVKIGRFVTGMEDMLRRTIGDGIEIETIISGGLWNTFVDPTQIENAVLNLAINARDAMDGYGKLTIELGNAYIDDAYARTNVDAAPGQYVMLAVTDTGSGMTPDVLAQAFEPFFSTKPEGKGTGLGLSMVYGFVRQSGGHVKIYSEVGQGTTVRLYLPRAEDDEDILATPDLAPVDGGSETILVAEDDEEVRATVVELLTDLGYRVLKAKDAAGALSVIESGVPIDLLFTDVVMPGPLKSPELARKARERLPGVAVLFTSGYTENSIVHGGRLDPGVELLSKPYTRDALARKIRQVLAGRR